MSALETFLAGAAKVASLVEPVLEFVGVAVAAIGLGGPRAAEAFAVVEAGLKALEAGAAGTLTPASVLAELAKLKTVLATNDAAADLALAAKFPPATTP